jgi:hypothetical protein
MIQKGSVSKKGKIGPVFSDVGFFPPALKPDISDDELFDDSIPMFAT